MQTSKTPINTLATWTLNTLTCSQDHANPQRRARILARQWKRYVSLNGNFMILDE